MYRWWYEIRALFAQFAQLFRTGQNPVSFLSITLTGFLVPFQNSIRHNLSLHSRFVRVQNEGTGKSSWWMLNPDAKPGKSTRRRANTLEGNKYEKKRGRTKKNKLDVSPCVLFTVTLFISLIDFVRRNGNLKLRFYRYNLDLR